MKRPLAAVLLVCALAAPSLRAGSIANSKHNLPRDIALGAGDGMDLFVNNYGEICVYCHTPAVLCASPATSNERDTSVEGPPADGSEAIRLAAARRSRAIDVRSSARNVRVRGHSSL